VETDSLGFTHIRMAQLVQGLPVVGGEMIVHIDNRNVVYYINGKHLPPVAISIEPSISSETVLQAAIEEFAGVPEVEVGKQPSLVVYGSHLAYHFVILQKGGFAGQWWHYVDAHTGELLLRYNNIQFLMAPPTPGKGKHTKVSGNRLTGEGGSVVKMKGWKEKGGNFYLYNFKSLWGVYDEGLVDWEQQASSKWGTSDRAAISAGYNFGLTQAWVKKVLKRNSFDDQGAFARANIHTSDPSCPNAWWDGTDFHFCDGDGKKSADTPSTDIVAHEYGHAITKYTSNLTYYGESGALNESYSDIMAAAVEFAEQPDGRSSYPHHTAAKADWLIGEDAWLEPLRDMKMPKRFGQPSYYRGLNWYFGSDDQGGVHTNNGVQNFAFYLLAEGGEGSNDGGCRFEVKGIGIKRAAAVAMRANMVYLSPASTYLDARKAWVRAATDLQHDVSSVEAAWAALGVGRYRDNGDGTVTDTCSNLNWQQSGDGKPRTWEEAKAYCAGIGWRLPRIDELETIVDYSRHSPTIDPVFESVYVDAPFWSSSTSAYVPGYAWYLYFYDGKPNFFSKTSLGYARCVRGGPFWPFDPSSHLTATDHTVLDTLTHLEWQRTDDGVARTMDEASSYCSGLELGGYDDWRLPAIQELETIIDRTTFEPAASRVFECRSGGYWSGSIMPSSPDYAWTVYFDHGYAYCNFKTIFYYVRCVRGGQ
jgi:Zn-dependent metalloprotease